MKYVVMQSAGGNIVIKSEWTDIDKAKQNFHKTCELLYSDADTKEAVVELMDENLDKVEGFKEFIKKQQQTGG